jgi:L-glyceraldehyde 3-phosphate reductase
MLDRNIENGLLDVLEKEGIGCIPFCPLAQGLLTDKYLDGIPKDSRAAKAHGFLKRESITEKLLKKIRSLNKIAAERAQSLAQMALVWILRDERVTTVLIGASKVEQVEQNVAALENSEFTSEELSQIDKILAQE